LTLLKPIRYLICCFSKGRSNSLSSIPIPSTEELNRMKYCKWHNAMSHDTNDCKIFRQQIQSAIE
jgi:hypothetical protein